MAKKRMELLAVRLKSCTIEVLEDIVTHSLIRYGDGTISDQVRTWMQSIISMHILDALKGKFVGSVEKSFLAKSHEDLCQLYLDYMKAERGEDGYKFVMGKALTYHEGDDENEKLKQFRQMPLKIAYIKTPKDKNT